MSCAGKLAGKCVVVTGAGGEGGAGADPGIGEATSLTMAAEGAAVACLDIDLARAENTAGDIVAAGGRAIALACDVASAEDCSRAAIEVERLLGRPTVLINNAGINPAVAADMLDEATWRRVLDVNLTGAWTMARALVPGMAAAGGGAIVSVGSLAGKLAYGTLAYGVSKAALAALTRELAVLHGRDGIRVNTVSPGHMATAFVASHLTPEMREKRRRVGPLGIEGNAWDVARAVLFLASDDARFITGADLPVDGGVSQTGSLAAIDLLQAE